MKITLSQLLKTLADQKGSDLHISVNSPPRIRIDGRLQMVKTENLSGEDTRHLCCSILAPEQIALLHEKKNIDLSFEVPGIARFRANIYLQKNNISGTFRYISHDIKSLKDLGLPPQFLNFCNHSSGLILVTGITGSGKSTSLAAMINQINETRQEHIITIEDPIEYLHTHKQSIITQREIGSDTHTFHGALRSALRQDPDVIMVGEMRDPETISAALTAAETGHLVLSTLHTRSAISSLNRMIDTFPPHQQNQVRSQLSMTLVGIVTQQLVPMNRGGRALALEILVNTSAVSALINEGKFTQIYSAMQSGQNESRMITMNQSLLYLCTQGYISRDVALHKSTNPTELEQALSQQSSTSSIYRRSS